MAEPGTHWLDRVKRFPFLRALSYRDFRWLWFGSFLSFTGTWIQRTAQDWVTAVLTLDDPSKLALVAFCGMAPVSFMGPIMGAWVDILDRRKLLTGLMLFSAIGPALLGFALYTETIEYWHIVAAALAVGMVATLEMPARQSIVRQVVPAESLAAAIPAQAMTFNFARVAGPAIGGIIASRFGTAFAFWTNAVSYAALIIAIQTIRADLGPLSRERQPIKDLVTEGFIYTFRNRDLKRLFLWEGSTAIFGVWTLAMMALIARVKFNLDESGLGSLFSAVGAGALIGLFIILTISDKPYKTKIVRIAKTQVGLAVLLLGLAPNPPVAWVLLTLFGMGTIMQFNTTNTLFQLIAPKQLRGRVLAMHMWAVAGLSPFGVLLFGQIAKNVGISNTLVLGGSILTCLAALSWWTGRDMEDLPIPKED